MRSSSVFRDILSSQHLASDAKRVELDLDAPSEVLEVICTIIDPSILINIPAPAYIEAGPVTEVQQTKLVSLPDDHADKQHTVSPELLPMVISFLAKYQMLDNEPHLPGIGSRIKEMLRYTLRSQIALTFPLKVFGYMSQVDCPAWEAEVA